VCDIRTTWYGQSIPVATDDVHWWSRKISATSRDYRETWGSYCLFYFYTKQESPAVADKFARRESMPKIDPIWRAYNVVADSTGWSIFIRLAVVASEILRNSVKIQTYTVESKIIDLGANQKRICTFLLATNINFGRISYRFEIFMHLARK